MFFSYDTLLIYDAKGYIEILMLISQSFYIFPTQISLKMADNIKNKVNVNSIDLIWPMTIHFLADD